MSLSRKEKELQRKQRRVTMLSGRLRSASKAVNLIPILKSSLVVVDCWLASLLDQANAVELMGKSKGLLFFFLYSAFCVILFC